MKFQIFNNFNCCDTNHLEWDKFEHMPARNNPEFGICAQQWNIH